MELGFGHHIIAKGIFFFHLLQVRSAKDMTLLAHFDQDLVGFVLLGCSDGAEECRLWIWRLKCFVLAQLDVALMRFNL